MSLDKTLRITESEYRGYIVRYFWNLSLGEHVSAEVRRDGQSAKAFAGKDSPECARKWIDEQAPQTTDDEMMTISKFEYDRLSDENDVLWAIFKTCPGCKRLVPGMVYGCDIQHHIGLSGDCNQKEELPLNKIVDLIQRFLTLMSYMTPDRLPDNYGILQSLQNEFSEVLAEAQR
jgi:hypothetical protein